MKLAQKEEAYARIEAIQESKKKFATDPGAPAYRCFPAELV
jgi:hypothetical protein